MYEDKLNLKYYQGVDTYSDGDIEDAILADLQIYDRVDDILMSHTEWPYLYHLSPIRENLLEWYDFNPEGTTLEIGSGCGAISGILCQKTKRVVGVDLSKKRSMINASKNRRYDNLEIMVGNFEDIELEEKFDYVTLIGVLEYSGYYLSGEDRFHNMLRKAKSYLKPGGTLIIAIENKYGLKYWAGAPEDHTGRPFDGIEGYGGVSLARTFSRRGLIRLLEESGLDKYEFFYPMPDYKLPTEIYSEDCLPGPGSIRNMTRTYSSDRMITFDEEKAYDSLCEDGMFREFANSFLVFCKC